MTKNLLVWFDEVGKEDVSLVGGKGANLGEMLRNGFPVPNGFIVTARAYRQFINENNLQTKIAHLLETIDYNNPNSIEKASKLIKKVIVSGKIDKSLIQEIFEYYKKLGAAFNDALVAVRSSATAEDLPNASFAGQQATYLNVKGEANLILAIKDAWASLFEARAIFYRHDQKFDHFKVNIAVPVQKMVASGKSGVMFSISPVTNDKTKIIIEAIYGLGEYIVQGTVTPDHYEVDKKSLNILEKQIATQKVELTKKGKKTREEKVSRKLQDKQKITDDEIKKLAQLSKKLENHYYFPQDSEWAIEKGNIYLVQTRPVTTVSNKRANQTENLTVNMPLLVKGSPASPGISSGNVRILKSAKEISKIKDGDVLVAPQTNPDFVPAMKKAVAIVTDFGGRTSHAAIVSREIGIPAVVGTQNATKKLKDGEVVTVNGTIGEVYKGAVAKSNIQQVKEEIIKTATKVYVNLAEPEFADRVAKRQVDGVGLLRAEFMMAGIGVHPKKMIRDGKSKEYVEKLADGLYKFCKSFSPRPVVYRASDFKTNEYRELVGGKAFEPAESNPMLGYRGAYRYIHDSEVFKLELEAIKKVRNKMGLKNLWLMLPFVRNVNELREVKKIITENNLYRSSSFKLWMMVEIPSNAILIDKFIEEGLDGVSIGSNDLTMLVLGTDRDNSEIAPEFDEQNEAVLWALERVIKACNKYNVTSSICGQAPSTYPELLEKLVKWGITSVSIAPDVIYQTRENISRIEKEIKK